MEGNLPILPFPLQEILFMVVCCNFGFLNDKPQSERPFLWIECHLSVVVVNQLQISMSDALLDYILCVVYVGIHPLLKAFFISKNQLSIMLSTTIFLGGLYSVIADCG